MDLCRWDFGNGCLLNQWVSEYEYIHVYIKKPAQYRIQHGLKESLNYTEVWKDNNDSNNDNEKFPIILEQMR